MNSVSLANPGQYRESAKNDVGILIGISLTLYIIFWQNVHFNNPSTSEVETGGSKVRAQLQQVVRLCIGQGSLD